MLQLIKHNRVLSVAALALFLGSGVASIADDRATPPATTMPSAKASIFVKVVDSDGKAVKGATVTYTIVPARKDSAANPAIRPITVKTDADGKVTLANIPNGMYNITAMSEDICGLSPDQYTVVDGKDATVTVCIQIIGC